jgi:hypothetical protein
LGVKVISKGFLDDLESIDGFTGESLEEQHAGKVGNDAILEVLVELRQASEFHGLGRERLLRKLWSLLSEV